MADTVSSKAQNLEEAFATFNSASGALVDTYDQLTAQVAKLANTVVRGQGGDNTDLWHHVTLASWFSNLIDALPIALVVVGGDGYVQLANPVAERWLGEALRGQVWRDLLSRSFRTLEVEGPEISLADGRTVTISTCPLGREPGQIVLIQDVTENRQLQQRILHYQRLSAMGDMAARLAHQIRTPLSSVMLYLSQLSTPGGVADPAKLIRKGLDRLHHLNEILNDMLLFSRGGTQVTENIRVGDLLNGVADQSKVVVGERGCRLILDDEACDAVIRGSRPLLISMLQNVVDNAVEACGRGGELCISSWNDGPYHVGISLQDNGPGIPPHARERVFEPFFTTRTQGTGLGLAIVQAIAQDHRADVDLQSYPGAGTKVQFRFPKPARYRGTTADPVAGLDGGR